MWAQSGNFKSWREAILSLPAQDDRNVGTNAIRHREVRMSVENRIPIDVCMSHWPPHVSELCHNSCPKN